MIFFKFKKLLELHDEKNVPHKDAWMAELQGEFKHFYEYDQSFDTDGVDSAIQHFPTFSQVYILLKLI